MPKVSVIIPNFNRSELLKETINNVLSQSLKSIEVIVVDDGSTDDSVQVVQSFGSAVNLICQKNKGPSAARNTGLAFATGEYVQFLDSDDLCTLNKLEAQVSALEENNFDMAYSPWVKSRIEKRDLLFLESPILQAKALNPKIEPLRTVLRSWFIILQACLFKRSFIQKVGYFNSDLTTREDLEFLFRAFLQKPKIIFVDDCLLLYRIHDLGNLTDTSTTVERRIEDLGQVLFHFNQYCFSQNLKIDFITWLIFQTLIWKCCKDLSRHGLAQKPKFDELRSSYYKVLVPLFALTSFCQRVEGHFRHKVYGARFSKLYQIERPDSSHIKRLKEMGFKEVRSNFPV